MVVPASKARFPFTVAVAAAFRVKTTLSAAAPKVNVFPAAILKALVIVSVFPDAAAPIRQFPVTVRLFKAIVGIAVIPVPPTAMLIIMSEPAGGPPAIFGVQFAAVVQSPPPALFHVYVAAFETADVTTMIKTTINILAKNVLIGFRSLSIDCVFIKK
jgi:hypothetical protein